MILEWREDYEIWGAFDCGMEEKGATIFSENELLRAGGRPSVRSIYWSAHLTSRRVRDAPRWSPSWPSSGWNAGASSLSNSAWYFDLAMVNLSPEMCCCVCALSHLRVGMFASILAPTPGSPSLPLSPAEDWFWLGHCLATDAFWLVSTVSGHRAQWRRAVPCGCQTETYTWILPAGLMVCRAQFLSALFLSVPLCFF